MNGQNDLKRKNGNKLTNLAAIRQILKIIKPGFVKFETIIDRWPNSSRNQDRFIINSNRCPFGQKTFTVKEEKNLCNVPVEKKIKNNSFKN